MPAFILLIPFFLIRFGLLSYLDSDAVRRAAQFAPMGERGRAVYWIYQIANVAVFGIILFSVIRTERTALFAVGLVLSVFGILLLTASVVAFAKPSADGMNRNGIYRFSRNPMYVAYFVFFLGCTVLTQSVPLLIAVIVFQLSSHGVILAEERWCREAFGEEYVQYMKEVRRYI